MSVIARELQTTPLCPSCARGSHTKHVPKFKSRSDEGQAPATKDCDCSFCKSKAADTRFKIR